MADHSEQDVTLMIGNFHQRIIAIVMAWLACSLIAANPAGADVSEHLGRLFLTPAQRAELDAERQRSPATTQADAPTASRPDAVESHDSIVVNGFVRRSDGPSTVWINGRTVNERTSAAAGIDLRRGPDATSRVLLSTDDGRSLTLKPGQVWLRDSGRILDCTTCAPRTTAEPQEPDSATP